MLPDYRAKLGCPWSSPLKLKFRIKFAGPFVPWLRCSSVAGAHPAPSSRLALTQNCLPTFARNFNSRGLVRLRLRQCGFEFGIGVADVGHRAHAAMPFALGLRLHEFGQD